MSQDVLTAAARAHALVSLSDGRTTWTEAHGFAARMRNDPILASFSSQQLEDASAAAFAYFKGDERFDDAAHEIALLLTTREQREAVIRAARAALVADAVNRDQENAAIAALAEAMGLDPRKA
jgi:tellurite resistance protein